jgi:DNA-binding GntR family transcriptional regulator
MYQKLDREPTRSTIRREIEARVRDGSLSPGDRISPALVARELGVSATPMREALIELVRVGYLENRSQYGFAVRPLLSREVKELYPLIANLESVAVRADPPDKETIERLDEINGRFAKARRPPDISRLEDEWHAELISRSDNQTLREMLSVLKARVRRYEDAYFRHSGAMPSSAKQHRGVTRALRGGDIDAALDTLQENWLSSVRFLVPWLEGVSALYSRPPLAAPPPRRITGQARILLERRRR